MLVSLQLNFFFFELLLEYYQLQFKMIENAEFAEK